VEGEDLVSPSKQGVEQRFEPIRFYRRLVGLSPAVMVGLF